MKFKKKYDATEGILILKNIKCLDMYVIQIYTFSWTIFFSEISLKKAKTGHDIFQKYIYQKSKTIEVRKS